MQTMLLPCPYPSKYQRFFITLLVGEALRSCMYSYWHYSCGVANPGHTEGSVQNLNLYNHAVQCVLEKYRKC